MYGSATVYGNHIRCLLMNEDFEEAEKLIGYTLKIKGIDCYRILLQQSALYKRILKCRKKLNLLKETRK